MSATTASPDWHRIDEIARALRRAAHDADVDLAPTCARRIATMAKGAGKLLGDRVEIHTVPATKDRPRSSLPTRIATASGTRTAAGSRLSRRTSRSRASRRGCEAVPIEEAVRARQRPADVARRPGINLSQISRSVMA